MKDNILKMLKKIHPRGSFESSENFIEDELIDSFDLILLTGTLEKHFNIQIKAEDIVPENFSSLEQIVFLVEKNRK